MPINLNKNYSYKDEYDNDIGAEESDLCNGWNKTMCFGIFPENSKHLCRPCESGKEIWMSVEMESNYGVCACLPKPVEGFVKHSENLISLGILLVLYIVFFSGFVRYKKRKK